MKKLFVKTSRQKRCLEALVNQQSISSLELRKIVGALNIYEIVRQLREIGWKIDMKKFSVRDRDGIIRHPGAYSLDEEHRIIAIEYLKEEAAEHLEKSSTAVVSFLKNNSNITK